MSGPRLQVSGLEKSFGSQSVLAGVSLSVAPGETVAIVGRSGCGKSTLLKCLNLIELPEGGEVVLDGDAYVRDGAPLFAPWEVRRHVALVFQDYPLFPNMTVLGNITLALRQNNGLSASEANAKGQAVAQALRIDNILDRHPQQISGGQAQRCALARAIVLAPKVFLLDEITSALDPGAILDVIDAIRSLRQTPGSEGMSVLLVTHLMQFAASFADRIAFLHDGVIHEEHVASKFFSAAQRPETRAFIAAHNASAQAPLR